MRFLIEKVLPFYRLFKSTIYTISIINAMNATQITYSIIEGEPVGYYLQDWQNGTISLI